MHSNTKALTINNIQEWDWESELWLYTRIQNSEPPSVASERHTTNTANVFFAISLNVLHSVCWATAILFVLNKWLYLCLSSSTLPLYRIVCYMQKWVAKKKRATSRSGSQTLSIHRQKKGTHQTFVYPKKSSFVVRIYTWLLSFFDTTVQSDFQTRARC